MGSDTGSETPGASFAPPGSNSVNSHEVSLKDISAVVQRIHIDGLQRTRTDIVVKQVKQLFDAKNFAEVVSLADRAKQHLELLGLCRSCAIHIDIDRGDNAKPNGYDVTYTLKESRRLTGGISTLIGTNEGSVLLSARLPNAIGRGERISLDYTHGSKNAIGWSLSFHKPLFGNVNYNFNVGVFQNSTEFLWSGYKQLDRGLASDFTVQTGKHSSHTIRWEGIWRDLTCLSRSTAFSVREQCGPNLKSSIKHTWTRDTRDSRVLPNVGHLAKVTHEFAGLGGDATFVKHEFELQANKTVLSDYVVQLSIAGGLLNPFLSTAKPVNIMDRLFLGGPLTFRGFQIKGIGPHEDGCALGADAYWISGVHLYTPLPFRPGKGGFGEYFRTHFFVNTGNVVSCGSDWKNNFTALANNVRLSYGAGVVLRLGGIARLELNYCVPVWASSGDKVNSGMQFGVGVSFL